MSAEIVNLRGARKRKARSDKEKAAATNRAKFGRSGAERRREEAEEALTQRRLEAHRREGSR